jgi:hypothetical protein
MSRGVSAFDVAARQGCSVTFALAILQDEERRGNAERLPDGRWTATQAAREKWGGAFADVVSFDLQPERRNP